ncbi:hypothetical protein DFH06DRAFT_1121823 [Mycena polygramma]|nr:hypothetical protein DFH06DRAFT_1121823 [Mycena polygramma]
MQGVGVYMGERVGERRRARAQRASRVGVESEQGRGRRRAQDVNAVSVLARLRRLHDISPPLAGEAATGGRRMLGHKFRVPGSSANMFKIILSLVSRLSDPGRDGHRVRDIRSFMVELHLAAMADFRLSGGEIEYHEYNRDGTLGELFHEIDLVPSG